MKYEEIVSKLKNKEISVEKALEILAERGYCPNLLNDDNGHWAVSFDGIQTVPIGSDPEDITLTCFVMADNWKNTIYDALLYSLEK